jgi:hypothetical protein
MKFVNQLQRQDEIILKIRRQRNKSTLVTISVISDVTSCRFADRFDASEESTTFIFMVECGFRRGITHGRNRYVTMFPLRNYEAYEPVIR